MSIEKPKPEPRKDDDPDLEWSNPEDLMVFVDESFKKPNPWTGLVDSEDPALREDHKVKDECEGDVANRLIDEYLKRKPLHNRNRLGWK